MRRVAYMLRLKRFGRSGTLRMSVGGLRLRSTDKLNVLRRDIYDALIIKILATVPSKPFASRSQARALVNRGWS